MAEYYDDSRGMAARYRMLNEVRSQVGHDPFTANCMLDLVAEFDNAAARMVDENRLEESDLAEAAAAARILLAAMAEVKQSAGFAEFREETLYGAKGRLCPPGLWPFC